MKSSHTLVLHLGLLSIACASCLARDSSAFEAPNIVVILADDLGYGDVQALNPERGKIATPNLDRLVKEGLSFTDAHSGSSVCTPTRYGLLTGRYAWRTRLQQGVLDGGNDEPLIAAGRLTLPGLLKQHGYHTACIGKWHLGFVAQAPADGATAGGKKKLGSGGAPVGSAIKGGPVSRGFDYYLGCSNARTMSSLIENDKVIERIEPVAMLPRLSQRAVEYVGERAAQEKSGQPFFLYFPLTSPHTPIVPSPQWQGKSGLGSYGDFVMQTDAVVGELLAALDKHGLADNTLVIFTADNGCSPAAGTGKLEQQGHFASERSRGYKADIWDGGHRVPFVVRWPGKVRANNRSNQLICLTDLMATCAEVVAAKLPADSAEDSQSVLPLLLGQDTVPREAVVHHSIEGKFAIRQQQWKLCLCAGSGGWSKGGGPDSPQLYDMHTDPGETKNLATQYPEVVSKLTKLLEQSVQDGRSTPGAKQANDVPVRILKNAPEKTKSKK
ncbi:arylsulfatase [Anatilimnocola sp. NA78]|uniref:sulfatase family protein n=1 Tax=Anatilimnocola sp. NA78 TaxID=3415683 RepID=UPI003CE4D3BF